MSIEHGTFTPLVFALNSVMSPECEKFHQHLASKIADKTLQRYSSVINMIRAKLSFLVLRACLVCVRGSRPHNVLNETVVPDDYGLSALDSRITSLT